MKRKRADWTSQMFNTFWNWSCFAVHLFAGWKYSLQQPGWFLFRVFVVCLYLLCAPSPLLCISSPGRSAGLCSPRWTPSPTALDKQPNKQRTGILTTQCLCMHRLGRKYWMIEGGEKVDIGLNNAMLINKYGLDARGNWLTLLMNHQYLLPIWKSPCWGCH